MSTMPQVRTFDARNDWIGSDIFNSYIRIAKGHGVGELKPYVDKMRQDHFPMKELKQAGMDLNYDFVVLSEVYTQNSYIKMMGWILGIIAFVLLFTSVMNYLLIIVGNLMTRSREMAVRKCYGAEPKNIHSIIFSEALVHVGLAVLLAALFIFLCKGTIRTFLSAPIEAALFCRGSWILVADLPASCYWWEDWFLVGYTVEIPVASSLSWLSGESESLEAYVAWFSVCYIWFPVQFALCCE